MGYYTGYSLTVKGVDSLDKFLELQNTLDEKGLIGYVFDHGEYFDEPKMANFYEFDTQKWYAHPEDMTLISSLFPDMTFRLRGDGEEWDDRWEEYYKNGKSEHCEGRMVYDEPTTIVW